MADASGLRHEIRSAESAPSVPPVLLLAVHALSVGALAGLAWVVQLVVYPSFLTVGPTDAWPAFHRAHSSGMTRAVLVPWTGQGATLGLLLLRPPPGVPYALVLTAARSAWSRWA